jgi:prevent-host-death family protein
MALMTIYDYDMVMKQVGIAELKAQLSEYLRAVRRGDTITVLDRNTPIARLVPIATPGLRIRPPRAGSPPPNKVRIPARKKLNVDILDLLMEERQNHR